MKIYPAVAKLCYGIDFVKKYISFKAGLDISEWSRVDIRQAFPFQLSEMQKETVRRNNKQLLQSNSPLRQLQRRYKIIEKSYDISSCILENN